MQKTAAVLGVIVPSASRPFYRRDLALAADGQKLQKNLKTGEFGNPWLRGYEAFFVLNSTEHEIYHAHNC